MKIRTVLFSLVLLLLTLPAFTAILSREGKGFLEQKNGQQVLHLKGGSYERGYQHGVLLKQQVQRNINAYVDNAKSPIPGRAEEFAKNIPLLLSFVPDHFKEEMQGLADGSEVPLPKIIALNLFPEMFHCSGITVCNNASQNGELYHVRVLDYSIGKNLQSTSVLQVVEPENGKAFLNVSYAGFIGCVTGMNQEKIAIGEIGGWGYGFWRGMPMAFLLREILEKASSLSDVKSILQNTPRTCEYYYVFSDGKTKESIGVYATSSQLHFIQPGSSYAMIAAGPLPENYGEKGDHDKVFLSECQLENTPYQTVLLSQDQKSAVLYCAQPSDCLLLTGYTNAKRYPVLAERVLSNYGSIDEKALMEIIKCPVAHPSNLHNAIFQPSELKVWISHAGPNDEPACDQQYLEWNLSNLLLEN